MARIKSVIALGALLPVAFALPRNANGYGKRDDLPPAEERAQAVVNTFRIAWEGYYTYAFPNDELKPVTNGFSNSR